ncbi:hypothetical protein O164_06205 [Pseudomonas taiwanensis SJ9]|uniref:Secreted protein n=1 Tax=Pseudomonas taiwanensis SJ9 TaxID=1388762 RepID=V7DDN5_9PSED|nr:hypothetical protein O164_06205 [Pseudomonas taiwanensis SJ9]
MRAGLFLLAGGALAFTVLAHPGQFLAGHHPGCGPVNPAGPHAQPGRLDPQPPPGPEYPGQQVGQALRTGRPGFGTAFFGTAQGPLQDRRAGARRQWRSRGARHLPAPCGGLRGTPAQ